MPIIKKSVVKKQQSHINSMCELLKNEISTFKKYQQEQTDISTYIDSMQNILKSQNNEFIDFNTQLEKLNYMIKQQIKLSNEIKKNECSKLSLSGTPLNNSLSLIEDQNAFYLKNLQNIQSQINNINRENNFDE